MVSGPYFIQVYKPSNYLIIFAKDPATGAFNTPVQAMRVSCGTPTPTGTYYTPARYRWLKMVGDTWAQWCTQIQGDYLFHSVPNWTKNNKDLEVYEYNQLGNTRSLGCIRLNCEDAKWIYDNCQLGTQVNISSTLTSILISIAVTALISGITIGGKALGKTFAIRKSTQVVFLAGRFLHLFHR